MSLELQIIIISFLTINIEYCIFSKAAVILLNNLVTVFFDFYKHLVVLFVLYFFHMRFNFDLNCFFPCFNISYFFLLWQIYRTKTTSTTRMWSLLFSSFTRVTLVPFMSFLKWTYRLCLFLQRYRVCLFFKLCFII